MHFNLLIVKWSWCAIIIIFAKSLTTLWNFIFHQKRVSYVIRNPWSFIKTNVKINCGSMTVGGFLFHICLLFLLNLKKCWWLIWFACVNSCMWREKTVIDSNGVMTIVNFKSATVFSIFALFNDQLLRTFIRRIMTQCFYQRTLGPFVLVALFGRYMITSTFTLLSIWLLVKVFKIVWLALSHHRHLARGGLPRNTLWRVHDTRIAKNLL